MKAKLLPLTGLFAAAVVACSLPAEPAAARSAEVFTPLFTNLALGGYDAVSYFEGPAPVKGEARFHTMWRGADFRFATAENLARFAANPAAFAPQYGGYCAWAVSQGHLAPGDPKIWKLVNGRLYLNFDAAVQRRWQSDIPGNVTKANANWPRVLH